MIGKVTTADFLRMQRVVDLESNGPVTPWRIA
jgi:hypothetical protein